MANKMHSSINELPSIRLASGVEPQLKWPVQNQKVNSSPDLKGPRLVDINPTQGNEGTVITVVVQALSFQLPVKLAFNNLMVDTQHMQVQNMATLVAVVPPFQQTNSTTSNVPVSICFLDKDIVTETSFISEFNYIQDKQKQNSNTFTVPFTTATTDSSSIQDFDPKHNGFLNTTSTYSNFYSSTTGDNIPYGAFGSQVPSYQPYYHQTQDQKVIFKDNQQPFGGYQDTSVLSQIGLLTPRNHRFKLKSSSHVQPTSVANYQPYPGLVSRTNLDIVGDLNLMAQNWTSEEWNTGRRLVQFFRNEDNYKIKCEFQPLPTNGITTTKNNTDTIIASCIYWSERNDFFITSVDCIYLLEALMGIRFSVEEKNRIRRNLEGFRPLTVSKCKPESASFFKLIMGFPNPKPRNIEKDVKVFAWKSLPYALKKIVTKYTASSFNNTKSK